MSREVWAIPSPLTTALLNTLARTLKSVVKTFCWIRPSGRTTLPAVAVAFPVAAVTFPVAPPVAVTFPALAPSAIVPFAVAFEATEAAWQACGAFSFFGVGVECEMANMAEMRTIVWNFILRVFFFKL